MREKPFTNHIIPLQKGDKIYLFSDGYIDQFGGKHGGKFMTQNFKDLLLSVTNEKMEKQESILAQRFHEWKKNIDQLDDVLVIGVEI